MSSDEFELVGLPKAVESTEPVVPVGEPAPAAERDYLHNAVEVGGLIAVATAVTIVLSAVSDAVRSRWP